MFERFTGEARQVVVGAQDQARGLGHRHIGTEHLLLALLVDPGPVVTTMVRGADPTTDRVHTEIRQLAESAPGRLGEEDAAALRSIGIDLDAIRARVEAAFGPGALDPPTEQTARRRGLFGRRCPDGIGTHRPFTPGAKKVLELALREAIHLKHGYIGREHLLLGLVHEGSGVAPVLLSRSGVDLPELRRRLLAALAEAA